MTGPLLLSGWAGTTDAPPDRSGVPEVVDHAGSLYAVDPGLRRAAARQLTEAGWWVHVDVIVPARGPLAGVSVPELAGVRADLPHARVEVHLIDLAASYRLCAVLEEVLTAAPDRVVLPGRWCSSHGHRVRGAGAQVWAELDRPPLAAGPAVDGVLVMLIEPGTTQTIDLTRLAAVRDLPAGTAIGVDGGVGPEHEARCLSAGVRHLVSGRALLHPGPTTGNSGAAAAPQTTTPPIDVPSGRHHWRTTP